MRKRPATLGWYGQLDATERRTFWACFAGFGLDSMDSSIYALVIPALIATLGLTRPEAGYLATAALVGAAVGGWGAGVAADRIGRIRVLQWTILWVALCTFGSAFATGFAPLALLRFGQGMGYGGEAAVGATLISEVVRPALRGRVASAVSSGYAVGYAAAVALFPVIASLFPQEFGWRVFFAIGLVPAAAVFLIRRFVPESGLYAESAESAETAGRAGRPDAVWRIFTGAHRRTTLMAATLSTGIFGGNYVMIIWLPTYLRTALGFSTATSAGYLAANIAGSLVGPLLYGQMADRVGRRAAFRAFLVLQALNVGLYVFAAPGLGLLIGLSFALGACQNALASGMTPTFAELFETAVRGGAQGLCLGGGRGFGSMMPALVGLIAATAPLGTAMGLCALSAYAVAFAATLALPETTGVELGSISEPSPTSSDDPSRPWGSRQAVGRDGKQ
ncbi:MFS transporter [Methylobacterium sp. J-077]|uniref:MFS transporter n=1 Tax=Methylobacterium sp. J-077 TaxID=2836656 RepID=UPI001FBA7554|nr:MFS transporter [Methylobacterium sp. J-077]MCJ2126976.1 MFS transporter [Methylobacterium sp. J-077]